MRAYLSVSFGISDGRPPGALPSAVRLRTLSRKRSPELMAESCGYLFKRRSACVPLPENTTSVSCIQIELPQPSKAHTDTRSADEDDAGSTRQAHDRQVDETGGRRARGQVE